MSERETPMTDAVIAQHHKRRVEAGKGALDHNSSMQLIGALAFHSEALERLCAELAEVLTVAYKWYNTKGDCPRKLDAALSWTQNDKLVDGKVEQALAKYTAMKEGK